MKNLNNNLFKKFEPHKISNLAKIVGGVLYNTTYKDGNSTGCDTVNVGQGGTSEGPCIDLEGYGLGKYDYTVVPCQKR